MVQGRETQEVDAPGELGRRVSPGEGRELTLTKMLSSQKGLGLGSAAGAWL